jgi:phospholipid/cholesterol/gamma-HCH transport system permease protein
MPLSRALGSLGDSVLRTLGAAGDATRLLFRALFHVVTLRFKVIRAVDGIYTYGVRSVPLVALAGLFVGMGIALEVEVELRRYGASQSIANIIAVSIVRELGPILTALVLAGRAGSGIAAELGSMKITDQLQAMRMLGLDAMRHLVAPLVVAVTLSTFALTMLFDVAAIAGGYVIAIYELGIPFHTYDALTRDKLDSADAITGLAKALCFGAIIAWLGCWHGLAARGGGKGLGVSTTRAVVAASFAILVADFFLTRALTTLLKP